MRIDVPELNALSPQQKRELLRRHLSERASMSREYPLSFAQERLWFLEQLQPGEAAYNLRDALPFQGPLDVPALERSVNELVRRHEALRTRFPLVEGRPLQRVEAHAAQSLPLVDLEHVPESMRALELERIREREGEQLFDLAQGPLFHATLVRLAEDFHVLLLAMHHLVSDGWSLSVIRRELRQLYDAFSTGQPSPLPELPLQYGEFARRQREWLQGPVLEEQLDFWRRELAGAPELLELPMDRPRPAIQTYSGAFQTFLVPEPVSARLKALAQEERSSLFMVLLAALDVLLYRYTGQVDLPVGTPIANRNHGEIEGLVGFFVNTVVIRGDLSGAPTFRELLQRIRERSLGAFAHQDLPFERLVEELRPARHLSHHPLFQVMMFLQNLPDAPGPSEAASPEPPPEDELRAYPCKAKFDLSLGLEETSAGLSGGFEYNTDLFDHRTVWRLIQHFQRLLTEIASDCDRRIHELPLMGEVERQLLLKDWNDITWPLLGGVCAHHLIEAVAYRTPDAIALEFMGETLTYGELNQRANQLAHQLIALGVGPEVPVGLWLPRTPELIIGVLAILKAGGAYLPLDPSYPPERIRLMLEDAGAPVVLTQEDLHDPVVAHGRRIAFVPSDWAEAAGSRIEPPRRATERNLAYVLYTSGSTGTPRGVMVEHRSLAAYVRAAIAAFELEPRDRVLQFASISFDVAAEEIFATLAAGATLVLRTDSMLDSVPSFLRHCRDWRLSVVGLPTAYWHEVVRGLRRESLPSSVRLVVIGGEQALAEQVEAWLERVPGSVRLLNAYGPTETTISATLCTLAGPHAPERSAWGSRPPIGQPLRNTRVYVLDERMQPVPVGVPGELYVGGLGVARGYLRDPSRTSERFLPDPFSREPGATLYRTGDRVRFLSHGALEFLGRVDDQVKIRGFRIELGEIEALLRQAPGVEEAVVVRREGQGGLVACWVPRPGSSTSPEAPRSFLEARLPHYMVPTDFAAVDRFPLTPTGKVDRRALRLPERSAAEGSHVAPRSATEEALIRIWREVIGAPHIGVTDNFFELGGHSLLATQISSRVREQFGVELPVRRIFEAPTVAELARELKPRAEQPPIEPEPETPTAIATAPRISQRQDAGPPPLSFAQERLWFLDRLQPGVPAYNLPAAIPYQGPLNADALGRSLVELVRRHEALRTTFSEEDGRPVQRIHEPPSELLSLIDLREMPESTREAELQRLLEREAEHVFDLSRGPLFRATLVRVQDAYHVLMLTSHHVVCDGWSMGILRRELRQLYDAYSRGRRPSLPKLALQYADFAVWQREWLQGDVLEAQLAYWRRQLEGAPTRLELPTDRPRPATQTFAGAWQVFSLPKGVSSRLESLAQGEGATLFMLLLAAFKVLLHRYTGQTDLVIGTPIANRNRAEIEELIGFFVNSLPLRTELSGTLRFRELLTRVRATTLGAYAHQDLPFEKLVEELRLERSTSHPPVFQVMFALQNLPTHAAQAPEIGDDSEELRVGLCTAKFDLTLSMEETPQGLVGYVEYNVDLFEHASVRRMVGHFRRLLSLLAEDLDARISDLSLLSDAERSLLLGEWNETAVDLSSRALLHRQVERWADRTPEAIAIVESERTLTYRELELRSNRIAHQLRALGARPEVVIAVCMRRSLRNIVGLLGILKTGAAYLPIDPSYPPERIRFMLEDAEATAVLVEAEQSDGYSWLGRPLVRLDASGQGVDASDFPESRLEVPLEPTNLAYVIYTSGSTGRPKGTEIHHGGLRNICAWYQEQVGMSASDRSTVVASPAFDASVMEIWPCLSTGATLLVPDEEIRASPTELIQWLAAEQVTISYLPTPLTEAVLQEPWPEGVALRWLLTGGDKLRRRPPPGLPFQVLNQYGPTECTVCATRAPVSPTSVSGLAPPIGRPVANTLLYVLDRALQPVPIGVPGELYIGGPSLGRGYRGRPSFTAERFAPDPFSGVPGARLYRTGDLVRYLPDGNLEFLQRVDQQVKIRGFRIELGEIEVCLGEVPGVREALVVARGQAAAGAQLVAYVVLAEGASLDEAELVGALRQRLPTYMIPSRILRLEQFPLTSSGKVDRAALPAPDWSRQEEDFPRPRHVVEEAVLGMWRELLGIENIGLAQSFFELGGHSLLLTQLASRIRESLGVEMRLRRLFEAPTIAGMALEIVQHQLDAEGEAAEHLLREIEQLSEAEASALLSSESLSADRSPRREEPSDHREEVRA